MIVTHGAVRLTLCDLCQEPAIVLHPDRCIVHAPPFTEAELANLLGMEDWRDA